MSVLYISNTDYYKEAGTSGGRDVLAYQILE